MPTDDEIIEKYDLEGDGDLGIALYKALNEARIDTAKQIFADLFEEMQAIKKKYKVE